MQRRRRASGEHDERVLFRRHPGVRAAVRLHLCVPQKGASPQQLAAVREERRVGRLLQSGSDRDAAPHCCGTFLSGHGFLCCLFEMIEADWTG